MNEFTPVPMSKEWADGMKPQNELSARQAQNQPIISSLKLEEILNNYKESLVTEIEKLKKEYPQILGGEEANQIQGFNEALNSVLDIIKKKKDV